MPKVEKEKQNEEIKNLKNNYIIILIYFVNYKVVYYYIMENIKDCDLLTQKLTKCLEEQKTDENHIIKKEECEKLKQQFENMCKKKE